MTHRKARRKPQNEEDYKILLPDALLLAGAVTIVVALHEMWPPLAYLACGVLAVLLAMILSF